MQTIETERAQPNGRNNNIIHQQEQEEAVLNSNQTIGTVESIFQNKYTEPIQKDTTLQMDTRNLLCCSELNTLDWELKQRPKVASTRDAGWSPIINSQCRTKPYLSTTTIHWSLQLLWQVLFSEC